jgi:hypothetical protein
MAITRRRLDFLKTIKQVYETTGLPVHYVQVAEQLGVSKWSAYDMLKTLETEGFLTSHYEVNQNEKSPGRAMVRFLPTPTLNLALSGKAFTLGMSHIEWRQTRDRLLSLFDDPKLNSINARWDQLLTELPKMESPLAFCAYVIAIVVSQLQTLSGNGFNFITNMAKEVLKGQISLAMFVGAAVGSISKMAAQISAVNKLFEFLAGFQKNLAMLTEVEQAMLLDFLETTLVKAV